MAHRNVARCLCRNVWQIANVANSSAYTTRSLSRFVELPSTLTLTRPSLRQNNVGCRWFASNAMANIDLSFNDLQALLKSGNIQLIDVREPKELIEYGSYPQAVNIPLSELKDALTMSDEAFVEHYKCPKPQPHHKNIVFCAQGPIKSKAALDLAKKFSFTKTRHYKGGWEEFHKEMGLPLKQNPSEKS